MALTAQQIAYLKSSNQRFRARIGLFAKYEPTVTVPNPGAGTQLTPTPILRCAPRYQLADNGETVNLYGADSYNRGGAYVGNANISFALAGGSSGTVVDGGDGTATYEAPGAGGGIATIEITVTNGNGSKTGYAFVQYPSTTYDAIVAEVASISASVNQHGYKMTLRARGDVSDFALGKGILLHVEDTWNGTESTFGGYQYQEGVFFGYITDMEYFEDAAGETWLGCEVQSPWWLLSRTPVGETHWGYTAASGRFYIADFRPVDAIWHFVNEITDFSLYHDCVLWYDQNSIDDFIIDASDLATIFDDVMKRTLSITYSDRYGSLFCIPDPDVRADEYWGTPAPTYTGSESLTPTLVTDYTIRQLPYEVKRLTLQAFDRSKKGIFAISENTTALGSIEEIRGLLCDQSITLASWAVQKRAQMNRQWTVDASMPLNHTMDLCNFADVLFTAPGQASGPTASGRTWLQSLAYRPNLFDDSWITRWNLLQQTEGVGEAETGAISAWGGTGDYISGLPDYSGQWSAGGWSGTASGVDTFCYLFDFVNSGSGGWFIYNGDLASGSQQWGEYVANTGWSAHVVSVSASPYYTSQIISTRVSFPLRFVTGVTIWASAAQLGLDNIMYISDATGNLAVIDPITAGGAAYSWAGTSTGTVIHATISIASGNTPTGGSVILSAQIAGLGVNPFGDDNCP